MKGIIGFVAGAAVGAVVSYLITCKVERDKATQQIDAVKAKMSELKEDNDILRDVRKKAEKNYEKPFYKITDVPEQENKNNDVEYNKVFKPKEVVKDVKDAIPGIKQVDESGYFQYIQNKSYGESVFTFYQGDGSLVDEETGMKVINPEKYVGPNGVDAMRECTVEEVYFVDEKDEIINCITIAEDSYYDKTEPETEED